MPTLRLVIYKCLVYTSMSRQDTLWCWSSWACIHAIMCISGQLLVQTFLPISWVDQKLVCHLCHFCINPRWNYQTVLLFSWVYLMTDFIASKLILMFISRYCLDSSCHRLTSSRAFSQGFADVLWEITCNSIDGWWERWNG